LSKETLPVYQPHYTEEETETNGSQKRAEIIGRRTTNGKAGYIGQLSKNLRPKTGPNTKK